MRNSYFKGEAFTDIGDVRSRAAVWCQRDAGQRIHGTTQCRPPRRCRGSADIPAYDCIDQGRLSSTVDEIDVRVEG